MRSLVVYDDFSGGEWGYLGPKKAAKNQFSGTNVMVYQDGQIGPRAGWRSLVSSISGVVPVIQTDQVLMRQRGNVQVWMPSARNGLANDYVYLMDSSVVQAVTNANQRGPGIVAAEGPNQRQTASSAGGYYAWRSSLAGVIQLDQVGGTQAVLAGSPASVGPIIEYGDRLVTIQGQAIGQTNTLQYSAPANYASWPAANLIPIGADWQVITGLYVVRGVLVIVMQDHAVFTLTGVPGVNEFVRQVLPMSDSNADQFLGGAGATEQLSRLWLARYTARGTRRVTPVLFGGSAQTRTFEHLDLDASCYENAGYTLTSHSALTIPLSRDGDVAIFTGAYTGSPNLLVRHNDVWSYHVVAWPNYGFPVDGFHMGAGRVVLLVINDDPLAARNWDLVNMYLAIDSVPRKQVDAYGLQAVADNAGGTALTGSFDLSEFWMPDGNEFTIRKLVVDATVYDTQGLLGGIDTPALTLGIRRNGQAVADTSPTEGVADRVYSLTGITPPGTAVSGDGAAATGQHRTFEFGVDATSGRSAQVLVTALKGMSIRRITVLGDVDGTR